MKCVMHLFLRRTQDYTRIILEFYIFNGMNVPNIIRTEFISEVRKRYNNQYNAYCLTASCSALYLRYCIGLAHFDYSSSMKKVIILKNLTKQFQLFSPKKMDRYFRIEVTDSFGSGQHWVSHEIQCYELCFLLPSNLNSIFRVSTNRMISMINNRLQQISYSEHFHYPSMTLICGERNEKQTRSNNGDEYPNK